MEMYFQTRTLKILVALAPVVAAALAGPLAYLIGLCGMPCCDHAQSSAAASMASPMGCSVSSCEIVAQTQERHQNDAILVGTAVSAPPALAAIDELTLAARTPFHRDQQRSARSDHVSLFILNSSFLI